MKLRIRAAGGGSSATTFRVEVPAACSLQGLQDAIVNALECRGIPFSCSLAISLNKTEPIQGHASALLSQLGICNGDLIFYFEKGASHPAMPAGIQPDLASEDAASVRRELCAAAATQRASSHVHLSTSTAATEGAESCVSAKPAIMVDERGAQLDIAHISTDMQIDGENLLHNDRVQDADAGAARVSNSIPAILQRILIAEHGHVRRPSDLLVLAVHAVMLETGFVVVNAMEEGYTLPSGWSNGGIANIGYTLPEIQDAGNNVGNVVLKSLTLGDNVVVYGTITGGRLQPLKLSMLASKYIISNGLSHDLISSYIDLFELWKYAKDVLSLPLLTAMCEMAGLPAPSCFLVIPTELKMKILECLPVLDLVNVGCSCSQLRHLSANDELWKKLFVEEFGNLSATQHLLSFRGWKAAYADRCLERKRMFERRTQPPRPMYGISSRFVPRFPRRSGIIGGDYDIYPFGSGPFRSGFGGARGPFGGLHRSLRDENMGDIW